MFVVNVVVKLICYFFSKVLFLFLQQIVTEFLDVSSVVFDGDLLRVKFFGYNEKMYILYFV